MSTFSKQMFVIGLVFLGAGINIFFPQHDYLGHALIGVSVGLQWGKDFWNVADSKDKLTSPPFS